LRIARTIDCHPAPTLNTSCPVTAAASLPSISGWQALSA